MMVDCYGIFHIPMNAVQKRNENYLLEPLGKSTTKEDHERIQISEREREVILKEKKKTENRNHESKGDHQEMKPRSGKKLETTQLLNQDSLRLI